MLRPKQGEYRAYAISPFHSLTSVSFAVLAMFYVCPNGATVFNNDECLDTPRYIHIWGVINSSAYFIVDLLNTVIIIREFTTYDIQMIVHHIISVITFLGTLVFMNFTVIFGVMLLFVEVSTTYICIRWLLYTHRLHRTCCQTVNTILCFVTFLLGRLIYQIFILFAYGYPKLGNMFDDLNMPWWKVTLIVEMTLAITVSALMNTYWMFLIIHQVVRMFKRVSRGGEFESETSGINDPEGTGQEGDKNTSDEEGSSQSIGNDNERKPLI